MARHPTFLYIFWTGLGKCHYLPEVTEIPDTGKRTDMLLWQQTVSVAGWGRGSSTKTFPLSSDLH